MTMARFMGVLAALTLASPAVIALAVSDLSGGWGMMSAYQRMYNPATIETVGGEVVAVQRVAPMKGMAVGVLLRLKTDKETVAVHLGPAWYIDHLESSIQKEDVIEVKGSRVMVVGKPAIIAAEVKKGHSILKLRDETGVPAWGGWRELKTAGPVM